MAKNRKLHFELTPANNRRLEEYIAMYNKDPGRVTPRIKTADVVNQSLDRWLSEHDPEVLAGKDGGRVQEG